MGGLVNLDIMHGCV